MLCALCWRRWWAWAATCAGTGVPDDRGLIRLVCKYEAARPSSQSQNLRHSGPTQRSDGTRTTPAPAIFYYYSGETPSALPFAGHQRSCPKTRRFLPCQARPPSAIAISSLKTLSVLTNKGAPSYSVLSLLHTPSDCPLHLITDARPASNSARQLIFRCPLVSFTAFGGATPTRIAP